MGLFDWFFTLEFALHLGASPVTTPFERPVRVETAALPPLELTLPSPLTPVLANSLPLSVSLPVSHWVNRLHWSHEVSMAPPSVRVVRHSLAAAKPLSPALPSLGQPCFELLPQPLPQQAVFQIQIQQQTIASLPDQAQAEKLAHQLEQALHRSDFDPSLLHPAIAAGRPVGKVGETMLFAVEPALAKHYASSTDVIAIAWINNLRSALGVRPLSLSTAQRGMYGLITSPQTLTGTASWYGPYFHGRQTATGEIFDQTLLTAAHPSLPFDTHLEVTNQETGHSVVVRINDRGPYFENRSLDLSQAAARCLNSETRGVVPYKAVVLRPLDAALAAVP